MHTMPCASRPCAPHTMHVPALMQIWLVAEGAVEAPLDLIPMLGLDEDM